MRRSDWDWLSAELEPVSVCRDGFLLEQMVEGKHGESSSHVENPFYVSAHKRVALFLSPDHAARRNVERRQSGSEFSELMV